MLISIGRQKSSLTNYPEELRLLSAAAATRKPEVGPIADLAISDSDGVGESVAGKVSEVDGLFAVSKDQARTFLFFP